MSKLRQLFNLSDNLDDDFLVRLFQRDSLLLLTRGKSLKTPFQSLLLFVLLAILLIPGIICIAVWSFFKWQIAIDVLIAYTTFILLILPIGIIIWQINLYSKKKKLIKKYVTEHPERVENDIRENRL